MTRLLVICQKVDETDDLLGFFVGWLREFSGHYGRVDVITLGKGEYSLPDNVRVHSLGKERGVPKFLWLPKLFLLQARLAFGASGIFCHMSPAFVVLAWPFAKLSRARLVLWYLHRSVTFKLRLALRLSDALVTADAGGLGITGRKIVSVGHGIDVSRFDISDRSFDISGRPLHILSVGRLSPIKDFGTLIRAAAALKGHGRDIRVRIVGRAVMAGDKAYEAELNHMAVSLGLQDVLEFTGFVPYRDMPPHYAWADVVVGCTPKGGLDKAILEGMAAGCIPFTSNDAMAPHLGPYADRLIYAHGDADALASRIAELHDFPAITKAVTEIVRERHALSQAVRRIAELL